VQAYLHDGFWQDISTLTSFFQVRMRNTASRVIYRFGFSLNLNSLTRALCRDERSEKRGWLAGG
jgi:ADP-glucose pyrophosphorylase